MLILARKEGESIVIDGDIVVTILKIGGGSMKIGITAPDEVTILRNELCDPQTFAYGERADR